MYVAMEGYTVELVWMTSDTGEPGVILLSKTTVHYTSDIQIGGGEGQTGGQCSRIQTTLY